MKYAFSAGSPVRAKSRELTGFDAAEASAVFFKLPCLKLIGHDKMISFLVRPVLAVHAR
jgi:hypothetical protein